MSYQATYKLLHLLIFPMELCGMQFWEAVFRYREMNAHMHCDGAVRQMKTLDSSFSFKLQTLKSLFYS